MMIYLQKKKLKKHNIVILIKYVLKKKSLLLDYLTNHYQINNYQII